MIKLFIRLLSILLIEVIFSFNVANAGLLPTARYDYFGSDQNIGNQLLVKSNYLSQVENFLFYIDGFATFQMSQYSDYTNRNPSEGFLQELYAEFNYNSFFLRLGKQAMRWSEMWTLPSLDIWTGRRFNRMFVDPIEEQLTHSTGANLSYAGSVFSFEGVLVTNMAVTTYPSPLTENNKLLNETASYGSRIGAVLGGFKGSLIAANRQDDKFLGLTLNYAFDKVVPKWEFAYQNKMDKLKQRKVDEYFSSLGLDLFLADWIVTPQVSLFDFGNIQEKSNDFQSIYFLGVSRTTEITDLQIQFYSNTTVLDKFSSVYLGWFVKDWISIGSYVQHYSGSSSGSLYSIYQKKIGGSGTLAGLRVELNGDFDF